MKHRIRNIALSCAGLLCLLIVGALLLRGQYLLSFMTHQSLAQRWSDEDDYAQLSFFTAEGAEISQNDLKRIRVQTEAKLTEASLKAEGSARLWLDAASAEGTIQAVKGSSTYTAAATGVSGDFFLFHPLRLLAGSYISETDLMHDQVVVDDLLAWQMFGSNDCVGMTLELGGKDYLVSGVVARDEGKANELTAGERGRVYMHLDAMGAEVGADCYEALLPNKVSDFAMELSKKVLSLPDGSFDSVENSSRYRLSSLFSRLKSFTSRSVRTVGVGYPCWENAAQVTEDELTLLLAASIPLLLFPAALLIILLITLWRRRRWRFTDIGRLISRAIDRKNAAAYYKKQRKTAPSGGDTYTSEVPEQKDDEMGVVPEREEQNEKA